MASIRNRNGKWHARVVRKGEKSFAKTFLAKQDAEKWARQIEIEIDKGFYTSQVLADKVLFKELIERYILEVTPRTRSSA